MSLKYWSSTYFIYYCYSCSNGAKIGEDKDLSVMANVELKQLFPRKKVEEWAMKSRKRLISPHNLFLLYCCFWLQIGKVTEMNLSANQERAEMEKKRLVWKVEEGSAEEAKVVRGGRVDPAKLVVELGPMEIRTFLIEFKQRFHRDIAAA